MSLADSVGYQVSADQGSVVVNGTGAEGGGRSIASQLTLLTSVEVRLISGLGVTEGGDYGVTTGPQTITIGTTGTGSGYMVSVTQSAGTAAVAVTDDDNLPQDRIVMSVGSITANSATASWTALPRAERYTVRLGPGDWDGTLQYEPALTNSKRIEGLQPGITYSVEVVDEVWQPEHKSVPVEFTTLNL